MVHECKMCNFSTLVKRDYERHLDTKKHKQNNERQIVEDLDNRPYKCPNCFRKFIKAGTLTKHEKTCMSSIITKLKNEKNMELQKKDLEIKFLKKEVESLNKIIEIKDDSTKKTEDLSQQTINILGTENTYHKELVDRSGKLVKTSMSALQYAKKHYPDAPVLLKYDNMEAVHLDKEYGVGATMIWHYENNTIAEAIGGIILKEYKREDPRFQSFWNSDFARIAYIIMDDVNNKKQWVVDKGGVRVQELLVDPILAYIRGKLVKRSIRKAKDLAKDFHRPEKYIHAMDQCNVLIKRIDNGTVAGKVMKYLSKFLNIKNHMMAIEDTVKPVKIVKT